MTNEELFYACKHESDARARKILCIIHAVRMCPIPLKLLAIFLTFNPRTVKRWINTLEKEGVEGLREKPRSGRPSLVSKEAFIWILVRMNKSRDGIIPKIFWQLVTKLTGIKYHITHIYRILHSLNMVPIVPQKKHVRAASSKECAKWASQLEPLITKAKKQGAVTCIQDESIFAIDIRPGNKLWVEKGTRPIKFWTGNRDKFIVYGTLTDDGRQFFRRYNKFNADTFIEYVKAVRQKFGKVFMIVDNAPQHKAKKVEKYLKQHGSDVILEFLPPGSPHLSAVEEVWRQTKREVQQSEFFKTISEVKVAVMEY